ncbi:restriction endonuclease subunit S [Bacteroides fragilis]|nr:restriction endonuclease subunit S [Bacteroides fragilis]NTS20936.1 restriction endonuclease subunit S [Bacteroides fragilis]
MIMANNNENKILNVPHLRFPEFSGEWKKCKLGDLCNVLMCKRILVSQTNTEDGVPFYKIGTIGSTPDAYISKELFDDYKVKYNYPRKGEVMITCAGTVGKCVVYDGEDAYFQDSNIVWIDNPTQYISNGFLFHLLSKVDWRKLNSTTIIRIYNDDLRNLKMSYPRKEEQQKISHLLSLLDERIATQNKIIYKLKSLIRGIMVELQKRGLSNGTWKKVLLSNVLTERNELNKSLYPVYSVSVIQGIVNQMEYLGRSFAASDTSKYHVVHYGDLVYTKSPTGSFPYGIIKQSYNQNEVAVSPLYGVYEPKTFSTGVFLHEYFKSELNTLNYLHPLVQKGAKNTINIANQRFLESYVAIPSNANELLAISKLLCSLNTKLEFLQNILKQSQGQKQYLLRQMFI